MLGAMLLGSATDAIRTSFTVKTDNAGYSTDTQFSLYLGSSNMTIYWGDGNTDTYTTSGVKTHTYAAINTYTIEVEGETSIRFEQAGDHLKVVTFDVWGSTRWLDLSLMFDKCTDTVFNTIDNPITIFASSMDRMFSFCGSFNNDISGWETRTITSMNRMFQYCSAFNQDLSGWDTSSVEDMDSMLYSCGVFNQDLSGWDTSSVIDMDTMFYASDAFNQDLSGWDTTALTTCAFFNGGTSGLAFLNCPTIMQSNGCAIAD